MNILLVAAEVAPYSSKRPAAESVANLAKALRLLDHSVTVLVPQDEAYAAAGLVAARRLSALSREEEGSHVELAHVFDVTLPSGVNLSLIDLIEETDPFSENTDSTGRARRLRKWGQSVGAYVALQAQQGNPFDVVHAHDCEPALGLLSVGDSGLAKVLTVHDAENTGTFPRQLGSVLGLSEEWSSSHGFGLRDEICLLKGMLSQAGAVIVPSEQYGQKLQAPEHHGGLARAFQEASVIGILEGVDQAIFNPATDAAVTCRYDAARPESKGRNRAEVLKKLELEFDPQRPTIFCEHDAWGDPSWSTLLGAIPALMRNEVTLILAAPDPKELGAAAEFSERLRVLSQLDESTRRQILAASDFYLSIRRKDPSGRSLMQASRYGAVPIAYAVDAVPDVIVDCDPELETGTGLLYEAMTQRSLQTVIARTVRTYRSVRWPRLLARVMRRDMAWDRAARRHVQVYQQLLSAR